jgi:hypothetical protein
VAWRSTLLNIVQSGAVAAVVSASMNWWSGRRRLRAQYAIDAIEWSDQAASDFMDVTTHLRNRGTPAEDVHALQSAVGRTANAASASGILTKLELAFGNDEPLQRARDFQAALLDGLEIFGNAGAGEAKSDSMRQLLKDRIVPAAEQLRSSLAQRVRVPSAFLAVERILTSRRGE